MNIVETARKWASGSRILIEWLGEDPHVVNPQKAQLRADVCRRCPHNKPFPLEHQLAETLRQVIELRTKLQISVEGESELHVCHVCLCPLVPKVHIPTDRVLAGIDMINDELSKFPAECWVRKEAGR